MVCVCVCVCVCVSHCVHFTHVSPLQALPVAPLYGDVQIKLPLLVKSLPHHDSSRWTCTSESLDDKVTFSVLDRMEQMRQEHVQIMSRLARYNNEVREGE